MFFLPSRGTWRGGGKGTTRLAYNKISTISVLGKLHPSTFKLCTGGWGNKDIPPTASQDNNVKGNYVLTKSVNKYRGVGASEQGRPAHSKSENNRYKEQ